ncbi:sulfur carrier protein ThiS [Fodinicola acaciae]|uniref:sulfur carrier protein ThiS n=1 Tax=Fodinicola acaciae TaxID=2681555 RepID=UPI0013D179A1|nr:sulfur carrier protein ThiS [Fodinicola acaciae]
MKAQVNGVDRELADDATVAAVIDLLAIPTGGIAVALDDAVVPRSEWGTTYVPDGGRVEILTATQGG